MNVFSQVEAIHAAARKSFLPTSQRQAYLQKLSVVLDYRTGYKPMRNGQRTIGRQVCREAFSELRQMPRD